MKCIIIGGVAGGATTAARLRRNAESAEILMIERGPDISYANCGLPYYIGGIIPERDRLFVQTPESFERTFGIQVRTRTEAIAIDRVAHTVTLKDLSTGEQKVESYDKLVLSPGAEPVRPPIPGINQDGIFTLRSVAETDAIKQFIETHSPRKAVIVGAGFIGLEMAENLHALGLQVTIVEMADQVMSVVDYEMASEVHQHLKTKHVEFYLRDGVASFGTNGSRITVALKSGRRFDADLVVLSIGVRPESRLAKESGIDIGQTGGIKVNSYLATNDPDIYAVGDAIEFPHPISGIPTITYLAGPANKQGRIAADNIAFGNTRTYGGAIATAIAKVFDITVASTGLPEKVLKKNGMPYKCVITHSSSHAGYYPDARPMTIKTIFEPDTGRLLGAQIVGYEGVDKRIDLFASILRTGGTVEDLGEIEHAYAPPYSSAKDPVNIAGFVAENVLTGKSRHMQWHELTGCNFADLHLVDVRTPEEYALGTIEGAVNIPIYELRSRLSELPTSETIVLFCGVGLRAYMAERILIQHGFTDVYNLSGGYKTYELATQRQGNEDIFEKDIIWKDDNIYQAVPSEPVTPSAGGTNGSSVKVAVAVETLKVDASGLQCPGPIMKLKQEMDKVPAGTQLEELATDPGFARDVESWCRMTGNTLLSLDESAGRVKALIRKNANDARPSGQAQHGPASGNDTRTGTTLVVFSDSLDRALATFVIANGAAASGKTVTLFFTFWGLSILRKNDKEKVHKDVMGRMFGWMLPRGTRHLGLSKINFAGMGPRMMRARMKSQNVASLEQMIESAQQAGVRIVACQMSMDIMGIKREELIDGVEVGGVATYLEHASESQVNLFV